MTLSSTILDRMAHVKIGQWRQNATRNSNLNILLANSLAAIEHFKLLTLLKLHPFYGTPAFRHFL